MTTEIKMDEIRVDSKDLVLKNNRVNSSIIPQTSAQLKRNIIVEGDVEVNGSAYGEKILINQGPCEFKKSVFGKEEFVIEPTTKGTMIFRESIGSNSVVSAYSVSGEIILCSDVNAKRVTLRNAYVGGSVYGDEVQLDNCVVIGGVFASKKLEINHSIVGTFNSQQVTLEGMNYLLYPSAFSVEPINASADAELWNITLADLMDLFKNDPQKEYTGKIRIDIENDSQKANLKAEDGTLLLVHAYSVAGKVLIADLSDFEKLQNHFLINAGSLSSHLMRDYDIQNEKGETRALTVEEIRKFFYDILDGRIQIADVDGNIDFEELKHRLGGI